jgi:hypothetical protein
MSFLDFPISPTLDQIYIGPEGNRWKWNGSYWAALSKIFETRSDYVYPYHYSGVSPYTTDENDPNWAISRINFTIFNSPVIEKATGSWTNRYLLIYT